MIMNVTDADIAFEMGSTITMQFADEFGAQDLRRVMRAVHPVIPVEVSGKNATFPIKHLDTVRAYLRGELSPDSYRKHMPSRYYAWRGTIYDRQ